MAQLAIEKQNVTTALPHSRTSTCTICNVRRERQGFLSRSEASQQISSRVITTQPHTQFCMADFRSTHYHLWQIRVQIKLFGKLRNDITIAASTALGADEHAQGMCALHLKLWVLRQRWLRRRERTGAPIERATSTPRARSRSHDCAAAASPGRSSPYGT